jgi:hypothetical protein
MDAAGPAQRYRDAGGALPIVTNIAADLAAPTTTLPDDGPFHLRCGAAEAATRIQRLAALGFDEAILVPKDHTEAGLAA